MSNTCVICGAVIPEGQQVCPFCEFKFEPNKDIINAMFEEKPILYNGVKYGCISAFIIRKRALISRKPKSRYILQVELMSKNKNSCVIADPQDVQILEGGLYEQSNKKRD